MNIFLRLPWKKIRFKTGSGYVYDGFIYANIDGKMWVSQNQTPETIGLAQNWIVSDDQVMKLYD